jgi:hypothetical protein
LGFLYRIKPLDGGDRVVTIDTNAAKSFAATRLAMPVGTKGGWELFGIPAERQQHELFSDHCCSEDPIRVVAKGRTVDEWKWKAGRPDNHDFDCLCGSAAGGSMLGCLPEGITIGKARRGRVILQEP